MPKLPAGLTGPVPRALGIYWGTVLLIALCLAGTLQWLDRTRPHPPAAQAEAHDDADHGKDPHAAADPHAATPPAPPPPASSADASSRLSTADSAPPPVPRPGAPVAAPDPALLEPSPNFEGQRLPRIGANKRMPMRAYAAGYDPADKRPRVALLLGDFGLNEQDTEQAIRALPPAISFAVAPYARRPDRLIEAARARGHELFAAVPLEPNGYPANNPGSRALLTTNSIAQNALNLEWALSRFDGYAGVTGMIGRMHGERFAAARDPFAAMLEEIARRGLLYLDPRPGAALPKREAMPPFRGIDSVVDSVPVRGEIDAELEKLERIARESGSAVGVVDNLNPLVIDRISAWTTALTARGLALVPVTAAVAPIER